MGRLLTPEDDRRSQPAAVAVLSHAFWQREYGGSNDVLGRRIHLDGHSFEIVGVAPGYFFGMDVGLRFDVAVPLASEAILRGGNSVLDRPTSWWLRVAARLRPGISLQHADAHLAAISPAAFEATLAPQLQRPYRDEYAARKFRAISISTGLSGLRHTYTPALRLLMGVVTLVLLIACANVANLLLARAAAR